MARTTIEERFQEFHRANPHVFDRLVQMARELRAQGRNRIGIAMLWEVLRYERMLTTSSQDEFKLNDNYKSRYVRLISERDPVLGELFVTRALRSA